jgi:hypothetical protein
MALTWKDRCGRIIFYHGTMNLDTPLYHRMSSVMAANTLDPEGGLLKLPGQRPALPGKGISFFVPLDPAYTKAGIPGHLPATRSAAEKESLCIVRKNPQRSIST